MSEFPEEYVQDYEDEDDEDDEDYETEEEGDFTEEEGDASDDLENAAEWAGRTVLPAGTWHSLTAMVGDMSQQGKTTLTVLVLGRAGSGRSSTVNTLLCERVATISTIGAPPVTSAELYIRKAGDFMLRVIDTPSTLAGERVNPAAFQDIILGLGGRPVDVVLYVDRLDSYRIDPLDKQLYSAITNHFGAKIWKRTIITLTGGSMTPPAGYTYDEFVAKRAGQLRTAMQAHGAKGADLPYVCIENLGRCRTNDSGDQVLPGDKIQMTSFMQAIVDQARVSGKPEPIKYKKYNPNRRNLWLVPLMIGIQWVVKKYVLDPVTEADGWRGDHHGDYDLETQKQERRLIEYRKKDAKAASKRKAKLAQSQKEASERRERARAEEAAKTSYKNVRRDDDEIDDDF